MLFGEGPQVGIHLPAGRAVGRGEGQQYPLARQRLQRDGPAGEVREGKGRGLGTGGETGGRLGRAQGFQHGQHFPLELVHPQEEADDGHHQEEDDAGEEQQQYFRPRPAHRTASRQYYITSPPRVKSHLSATIDQILFYLSV